MRVNELKEFKAKKEGKVTPKALIENLLMAIENGEIESVVFVARSNDQEIKTGWSDFSSVEALGLLTCGQHEVISGMHE
ncbi:hypothetical protein MKY34_19705 [Sporosarcina sp. FSL K6-1522]|uniref:hypothetical protein n=1 Tax=Sporosarcina sp. FSL K6-1522 TaxID=2921554 RepID=UPI00315A6CCE